MKFRLAKVTQSPKSEDRIDPTKKKPNSFPDKAKSVNVDEYLLNRKSQKMKQRDVLSKRKVRDNKAGFSMRFILVAFRPLCYYDVG